jgi:predicted nucleic acid-binding protein
MAGTEHHLGTVPSLRAANPSAMSAIDSIILDTNVVLDALLFRNPECAPLVDAITQGRVRWLATAWMREELAYVVARGLGSRWPVDWAQVAPHWDRWASMTEAPATPVLAGRLQCSDPDDQAFIDLAVTQGCRWLVSRDRAVLKLRRRAQALTGLRIVPPREWRLD